MQRFDECANKCNFIYFNQVSIVLSGSKKNNVDISMQVFKYLN